ncbi:hypothetical protein AZF37_00250 [endosymbiont 'TC1' of Trimyema compressum]|nr:hypothetical protein AZF37_00250 [endosymbiont 'TC1' of Trimyema compressum]
MSLKVSNDTNKEDHNELSTSLLAALSLDRFAERHPMTISGGRKIAFGYCCMNCTKCKIMALDEPTSGLDYTNMYNNELKL